MRMMTFSQSWQRNLSFHVMGVHMSPQIHLAHEGHTTVFTRERLESFVFPTVRDQIGRLAERLATEAALVWLLSGVDVGVLLHVRLLVEPLATEMAFERARVRMNQHVRGERRRALKALATNLALEWLLARMHDHVLFQADGIVEYFLANLTAIQLS